MVYIEDADYLYTVYNICLYLVEFGWLNPQRAVSIGIATQVSRTTLVPFDCLFLVLPNFTFPLLTDQQLPA